MDLSKRWPLWRETAIIALYVSIVLLAELIALPDNFAVATNHGPTLVGVIWGTAFGLALAHWFAFQVAAAWFSGGKVVREDVHRAGAQLAGAALVAIATTIPVLFVNNSVKVEVAAVVPSLVLGASGFMMGRASRRSFLWSLVVGVLVLAAGVGVAVLKASITNH